MQANFKAKQKEQQVQLSDTDEEETKESIDQLKDLAQKITSIQDIKDLAEPVMIETHYCNRT